MTTYFRKPKSTAVGLEEVIALRDVLEGESKKTFEDKIDFG